MVLENILNLWNMLSEGMQSVYDIMTSTLIELFAVDIPLVQIALTFLIDSLGIGDWTLIDLMFGVGLPYMVVFSVTKWLKDILP